MISPCWYALSNMLFSFACFYTLYEWNHSTSLMAHGFVLGHFKLHLHCLLFNQQMAAGVLKLDLGNPEGNVKFSILSLCESACFTSPDP